MIFLGHFHCTSHWHCTSLECKNASKAISQVFVVYFISTRLNHKIDKTVLWLTSG